jgi:hypothetical protein
MKAFPLKMYTRGWRSDSRGRAQYRRTVLEFELKTCWAGAPPLDPCP